jgi:multiple sugar transport system substrate-binding protein/sn-glycerol 3-phosphate transport system substrate-binding protein
MNVRKLIPCAAAVALVLAACAAPAAPAPAAPAATTAPAAPAATTAPAQAEATQAPEAPATVAATEAPAATQAPAAAPPGEGMMTPEDVDAIDLTGKNVTVKFWHNYSGAQVTGVLDIVNDFNANNPYGIKVELEKAGASYDELYNKISASLQGGDPPALARAYQNQAAFYRNEGAVIDLSPFIQSKKYGLTQEDLSDYYPFFLDSDKNPQYPGEVLGWPTNRSMEVLYTNLDWLQKLGANEPPKTLKEFEDLACKASDKAQEQYGYIWKNDASDFAALVFALGGSIMKPDASGYDFNSPAGVEALTMLQRLFKNGCAVELPKAERFGEQSRFANGKLLFVTSSNSGLPFYVDSVDAGQKFKWTISMFPQADPANPKVDLFGASWSVLKTTPEQQLASWLFMKFFTETENSAKWSLASNYIAVRQSAAQLAIDGVKSSDRFKNYPEAATGYAQLYDAIQYGAVEAPVAGYDPVRALIQDVVTNVAIKGEGDPKAALDEAVAQADDILAENAPRQ